MSLALTLARRDLRGGWSGLGLLWLCLALSVAGLAAVTSLASAIDRAIADNGRSLLGGDLMLSIAQRAPTSAEASAIAELGPNARARTMRAMVVVPEGPSALAELTAIERGWPVAGRLAFAAGGRRPAAGEVALDPKLARRLGVAPGSALRIGRSTFRVSGLIAAFPRGGFFPLAPPVLIDDAGLDATGLVQPGSLVTTSYRLLLPPDVDPAAAGTRFQRRFGDGGWRATSRDEAGSGTRRLIERLGQMLALVALAALAIGGLGIASAAAAFAASRRPRIAILKLVGARRSLLLKMLGSEVALVAASAIVAGLAIGAATPALVGHFATDLLPVAPDPRPQWLALLLSAGFGLLVTFAASWRALAGAIATRPLALLRGDVAEDGVARVPRWPAWAAIGGAVGLALIAADQPRFAATAIAAIGLLAALFALLGVALRKGARRWSHRGGPLVRLGLAALDRPGAATGRLLVSLGVGLSLLVALAATASSLLASIASESEARAPALFLLDIPRDEQARFEAIAARTLPDASLRLVPSLRGPVIAVNGTRVVDLPAIPEGAWVLRGDRGLTFARDLPDHNRIVSGAWWPKDYAGPPLISLDADAAKALGLKVGDRMTIGVLGRPIEARIASLRQIDWRSLGFNFAIIFDPATLSAAPFTWMASVATPRDTAAFERAVGDALPMASTLRVAEIVSEIARLLAAIEGAVRVAAGFALAIGMVVLAGSVVATRATRQRDIVLLRLVGATSAQVIATQAIEFLAIATAAATGAAITGIGAAYGLTRWQFDLPFAPDWASVLALPLAAILLAAGAALAAAQAPLRARPAAGLRTT